MVKEIKLKTIALSLLSIVSKVLERCLHNNSKDHLVGQINDTLHDFVSGKSRTSHLVEVLDYILDSGKQTGVIYMDMSNVFDKVNHKLPISKLYNNFGSLHGWFCSHLSDRKQHVTRLWVLHPKKPSRLDFIRVRSLVLSKWPSWRIQNSKVASFADDTKLFKCVDSHTDDAFTQQDLCSLESWSATSGLVFNQGKCKCQWITRKKSATEFLYTIRSKKLTVTPEEKDLGIWVTNNLTDVHRLVRLCIWQLFDLLRAKYSSSVLPVRWSC